MNNKLMNISAPIIHDSQLATKEQVRMENEGRLRNAFSDHQDLSIFTGHNYSNQSLLERNLDFLGLKKYHVIHIPMQPWHHSLRVKWFIEYLENQCTSRYVLYLDADDVIIRNDPSVILELYKTFNAKLVYNSTRWLLGYKCMPDRQNWAAQVHPKRYLNAGACIGERQFLLDVFYDYMNYCTENPIPVKDFFANELKYIANFPKGLACDQTILRYIEPAYYPDLKIDEKNLIFYRNEDRSVLNQTYLNFKKKLYKTFFRKK